MITGKRVLAVCPARGGSKGLPGKNLMVLNGKPLVARVGELIGAMSEIDCGVISTDDEQIAEAATRAGLAFHGFRPAEFASDEAADWPVLNHELLLAERRYGVVYDLVIMLQPTSPLRLPEHVRCAIQKCIGEAFDSVWTVSRTDSTYHPLKQLKINDDGVLDYHDAAGAMITARQQLSTVFHRNGAAYVMTRQCIVEQGTIKGARPGAVVIKEPMVSIDTMADLELCEKFLKQREGLVRT